MHHRARSLSPLSLSSPLPRDSTPRLRAAEPPPPPPAALGLVQERGKPRSPSLPRSLPQKMFAPRAGRSCAAGRPPSPPRPGPRRRRSQSRGGGRWRARKRRRPVLCVWGEGGRVGGGERGGGGGGEQREQSSPSPPRPQRPGRRRLRPSLFLSHLGHHPKVGEVVAQPLIVRLPGKAAHKDFALRIEWGGVGSVGRGESKDERKRGMGAGAALDAPPLNNGSQKKEAPPTAQA